MPGCRSSRPPCEASDCELAIALGLVSTGLPKPLDGLVPLLDLPAVALIGPRDRAEIDAEGGHSLRGHLGLFLDAEETRRAEDPGATALGRIEVSEFWLHVDLDVLASDAFDSADYLQPGGLTWSELDAIAGRAIDDPRCKGASVVIYNPEHDPERRAADQVVEFVCRLMARRRGR